MKFTATCIDPCRYKNLAIKFFFFFFLLFFFFPRPVAEKRRRKQEKQRKRKGRGKGEEWAIYHSAKWADEKSETLHEAFHSCPRTRNLTASDDKAGDQAAYKRTYYVASATEKILTGIRTLDNPSSAPWISRCPRIKETGEG